MPRLLGECEAVSSQEGLQRPRLAVQNWPINGFYLVTSSTFLQIIWEQTGVQLDQSLWWDYPQINTHEHLQCVCHVLDTLNSWYLQASQFLSSVSLEGKGQPKGVRWASGRQVLEIKVSFLIIDIFGGNGLF